MELLEREAQRDSIRQAMAQVRLGHGRNILVSGEAGVGKTSFVADFTEPYRQANQLFWGACDPLFTPRPLGPLYDIALQNNPGLLDLLNSGANWMAVALALLKSLLDHTSETILVFEDVHWADEATLDLIKYLGRRIDQTRSMLILTYREDEPGGRSSLREVLGDFPPGQTVGIPLEPLSKNAVAKLARDFNRPAEEVYRATKGNPFFVTEVLRSQDEDIPKTVRHAILTRSAHLAAPARAVLELVSVIPGPAELGLLEHILHPEPSTIDACIESGFLIPSEDATRGKVLSYRHELARLAISESILFARSRELHQKILLALRARKDRTPLAVLVHHALEAEDEQAVLEYAPQAAREASYHGAHREASRHYQTALRYSHSIPPEEHARLLDGLSFEYYITGQMERAAQLRKDAILYWQQSGREDRTGDDLRWLSRIYWFQGNKQEADRYASEAVSLLEQLPPGQELAMAYSNRSQLHMLAEETAEAVAWGNRALQLAETIQDHEIIVHALTNIGTAELLSGDERGLEKLVRALTIAKQQEMHDHVARCYANIVSGAVMHRDYASAKQYLSLGIAYTSDRDMDSYSVYLRGWQARMHFELGEWAKAVRDAEEVLRMNPGSNVMALPAVTTIGYVKMRQGDEDASKWLDQARDMAQPTGELQRIGPVAAARAEAAWWSGDRSRILQEVSAAYKLAAQAGDIWLLGQMMYWIWRAGGEAPGDARIPLCYRSMMEGDWRTAAQEWERISCPYERAVALSEGGQEDQIQALAIFEQLEARPAIRALREKMRSQGIKGLPRGPRPNTRSNPEGLTAREMEILALLVEGMSNADIARQLSISFKTVDHHVSMILAKLEAHSRLEAAAIALQKHLLPTPK